MDTHYIIHNHDNGKVVINHTDGSTALALKIVQALFGLIFFLISSPITVPLILAEMRREEIDTQRRVLLKGGE